MKGGTGNGELLVVVTPIGCLQVGRKGWCGGEAGAEPGGARWCHGGYSAVPPNSVFNQLPHCHVTL